MTPRYRIFLVGVLLCTLGIAGASAAEPTAAPTRLELGSCDLPSLPPDARCGTYEVYEDRAARSGRRIPLRVVVIPALGDDKLPDPFIYFAGGPGGSSVNAAGWIAEDFEALRQRRDILLVDFRGTGDSAGLFCEELQGNTGIQGFLDDFLPAEQVRQCAGRLTKTADLLQYTSANTIDDIDEIRAALGHQKLNIFGVSAGTRLALVYLRRHPERVRTAILWGAVPTDELGPLPMARSAQDALDGLIAECERDDGCRTAFPELRQEVTEAFRRVGREPVVVQLTDTATGEPVEVRLSRTGLAQTIRYMLYVSSSAVQIPLNIQLAARGDWRPMVETARSFASDMTSIADGYYLALTCSEDIPFLRVDEIPAVVAGTFLGDFRIRKQQEACKAWPAAAVDREFLKPVVSDVPVLLISGGLDPVTPRSNGDDVSRTLKNSRHVVVKNGGHGFHGFQGTKCLDELIVTVVETGTVDELDTTCMEAMRRPEFVLEWKQEIPLEAADLTPLTGTYKDPERNVFLEIELVGDRLRAVLGDEPPRILIPTSPTRFRIEGLPPGYAMVFQRPENGPATAVVFEGPGEPARTFPRERPSSSAP